MNFVIVILKAEEHPMTEDSSRAGPQVVRVDRRVTCIGAGNCAAAAPLTFTYRRRRPRAAARSDRRHYRRASRGGRELSFWSDPPHCEPLRRTADRVGSHPLLRSRLLHRCGKAPTPGAVRTERHAEDVPPAETPRSLVPRGPGCSDYSSRPGPLGSPVTGSVV